MDLFPFSRIHGSAGRAVAASTIALGVLAVAAGCGKTITIGDSTPAAPPAAAPVSAASAAAPPSATTPAQSAGNGALQVVDSSAAQNGKTGDGGTVVGLKLQENPPVWVQLSTMKSDLLDAPNLVDINQATLYRFDKDSAKPSKSTCNDACATKWPPVTIKEGGNVYLAGVDPDEVSAIRRADGDAQITVGGWPIYRFSGDSKPGELKGQGVSGTWFAVGLKGQKVTGSK